MQISRLQFITDSASAAELACRGGVRWVQLRVKNLPAAEWQQRARAVQAVCRHHGAALIINDNPALALAMPALVLAGHDDYTAGPKAYRAFHFPHQQVVVLPGGHNLLQEQPAATQRAIRSFVAALPAGR